MLIKDKLAHAKSHNQMIINMFIQKKAVDDSNSIYYNDIHISILDNEKRLLLNNLIKDGFVRVKSDKAMWFDEEKWNHTSKKFARAYFMILVLPIIITAILIAVLNKLT